MLPDREYEMMDVLVEIKKAIFILRNMIDQYECDHTPTAHMALKYAIGADKSLEAKQAYNFMYGYENIMTMIHIALDYCVNVQDMSDDDKEEGGAE